MRELQRTFVIYDNKIEGFKTIAKNIAYVLGPSNYCSLDEYKSTFKNFDVMILVIDKYESRVYNFIKNNIEWIKLKKVAVYRRCIIRDEYEDYNSELKRLFGSSLIFNRDYFTSEVKVTMEFAMEIKSVLEENNKKVDYLILKREIDKFIYSFNTCTLSTACDGRIRGTPIEYIYENGYMYFLTEGGEKFSNILLNPIASISIYRNYDTMENIAGMQISAETFIVDRDSDEYKDILKLKKVKYESIAKYQFQMNIIKAKLYKAEFLYHKFKNMGYDIKQIFYFNKIGY